MSSRRSTSGASSWPQTGTPAGPRRHRAGGTLITRGADYGVRAMVFLARLPLGRWVSQAEVASAIGAPTGFVRKVLQQLSAADLVKSRRGKGGGVRLDPVARGASMYDVVAAIDGPPSLNQCASPYQHCDRDSFCPAHEIWRHAQARVVETLTTVSIDDIASGKALEAVGVQGIGESMPKEAREAV